MMPSQAQPLRNLHKPSILRDFERLKKEIKKTYICPLCKVAKGFSRLADFIVCLNCKKMNSFDKIWNYNNEEIYDSFVDGTWRKI